MSRHPTIECKPNGPYLVKDLENLHSAAGERLPTKAVIALCRCGGSANKPFCDATHQKNGFSGAKLDDGSADKRVSFRGAGITIYDNRSICAHAGHCTDGLAAVFQYDSEPWIDPNGAATDAIIATIRRCPSGALSYALDASQSSEQSSEPGIAVTPDGPYAVEGPVDLLGQTWADGASTTQYTLCRCGASRNKPFCDGTHWSIEFKG